MKGFFVFILIRKAFDLFYVSFTFITNPSLLLNRNLYICTPNKTIP
ncbi:hypothetical protein FLAVO9R_40077 [Flavobacterium sp. 9R]|nr:hypothetical protein FLAVO9R_40077 [Flavobacterium sp. 9R]